MKPMETKKQTAVEWLQEAMTNNLSSEIGALLVELFDEAKAMEKEQIIDFARFVLLEAKPTWDGVRTELSVEEYYNETYGK